MLATPRCLVWQHESNGSSTNSDPPDSLAHRRRPGRRHRCDHRNPLYQSASSAAPSFSEVLRGDHGGTTTEADGAVTEDDGAFPDGVTVFDDEYPGIANLDRGLLQALREAATDAADDGIEFYVNSGWRSPEYQNQLLREAVSEYGSEEEAARWVATVDTSAHVSGDAVDIWHLDATAWLSEHGAGFGLSQIYGNE